MAAYWRDLTSQKRSDFTALTFQANDPHQETTWFAMFDSWEDDYIVQALSMGYTITDIATANGVPPFYLLRYTQRNIAKDKIADARRSAAIEYASRAMLALEVPDKEDKTFIAQVQLAKAQSELYISMAERLSPGDYAPPVPTLTVQTPVGLTMHFDKQQPPAEIPEQYRKPVNPFAAAVVNDTAAAEEPEVVPLTTHRTTDRMQDLDQKYREKGGDKRRVLDGHNEG